MRFHLIICVADNRLVRALAVLLLATAATAATAASAAAALPISQIQGAADLSPLLGRRVSIEAVVVGDFQNGDADRARDLHGFFVQEERADEDGDRQTSEGLFVYDKGFGVDVRLGDKVRVNGTVAEYFGETQLSSISAIEVLASGALAQVRPAEISLAEVQGLSRAQGGAEQADLEAWEGMLVNVRGPLQISEQFHLDRYNEITLVSGERPYQFSQRAVPSVEGYRRYLSQLAARSIRYDDGLNSRHAGIDKLDGFAPYSTAGARRMGDQIAALRGVLDYKWAGGRDAGATWRVRAVRNGDNAFTSSAAGNSPNPRGPVPALAGANLSVAAFNLHNYFTTLDRPAARTARGHRPRGANSGDALARQQGKLVTALLALNADVVGLTEIENDFDPVNDGSTALETLVNALNTAAGGARYRYVYPGRRFAGGDAIAVAFIYQAARVQLCAGARPALLNDTVAAGLPVFAGRDFRAEPIFDGRASNRAALAVSFTHLASGDSFTAVAVHLKSKNAAGLRDRSSANYDREDGAGYWNQRRLDGVTALTAWLNDAPTGLHDTDLILLGDFNAYAREAPLRHLRQRGFRPVVDEAAYTYVFNGLRGSLDYQMVSASMAAKLAGAGVWHINADEARVLDYRGQAKYFDPTSPYRASDHDPVLAGFSLK